MICPPFAVCAGERLKVPHAPALPQVAVQFTPSVPGVAVAVRVACEPVFSVAGGGAERVTVIGVADTTVAVATADFVGSVTDFAVMVIVPPTGTLELFVKVAVAPLGVWLVIAPQLVALQLTVQSTPAFAESLETTAARWPERSWPEANT